MSKIIKAINSMISNPDKLGNVTTTNETNEIFFTYGGKHKWSITLASENDSYFLHFYPGTELSIQDLSSYNGHWEHVAMVTYSSSELGGREAVASMRELYTMLREKVYGVDEVLDEIISDDIPF